MEDIPAFSQETEGEAHIAIGIEDINMAGRDINRESGALTRIRRKLKGFSQLSSQCCIYRVPGIVREVNSKMYTPRVVSIGPFHYGKRHLQAMEEHKFRYLKTFLGRTSERSLEDCFEVVRGWEERARSCYAETINLNSDEFVQMILVDGSFIVECLLRSKFPKLIDESDRIFNKPWIINDVSEDMILLENQLPFFVLENLFKMVSASIREEITPFFNLVSAFFISSAFMNELPEIVFDPKIQHFVDFARCSYLRSLPKIWSQGKDRYKCPPSVTQLHEAGIKFKRKTRCSLFDIKFTNGILIIPELVISSTAETLLRNLIAFEECHCEDRYIIQYMNLLKDMIKTSKDVDLLIRHSIIRGVSGREPTLRMFEKICSQVHAGRHFYFSSLSENLNAYCKTGWNRWKATLTRDYFNTIFNTPWKNLCFGFAVTILILTFIQTVCTLIAL